LDRKLEIVCAWAVAPFALLFLGGCVVAGFIPPPSPAASAREIADFYGSGADAIRIGCVLMMVGAAFVVPWGIAIAGQVRRMEGDRPILTYMQVACIGFAVANLGMTVLFWAAAAYRPNDTAPDVIRTLNDLSWFLFSFQYPIFCVWFLSIAAAIFRNSSGTSVFPRWVAHANVGAAVLSAPYELMLFFKTGPFSSRGLITFYFPTAVTLAWMAVMTIVVVRAVRAAAE
jgi:hypothetical protein